MLLLPIRPLEILARTDRSRLEKDPLQFPHICSRQRHVAPQLVDRDVIFVLRQKIQNLLAVPRHIRRRRQIPQSDFLHLAQLILEIAVNHPPPLPVDALHQIAQPPPDIIKHRERNVGPVFILLKIVRMGQRWPKLLFFVFFESSRVFFPNTPAMLAYYSQSASECGALRCCRPEGTSDISGGREPPEPRQ